MLTLISCSPSPTSRDEVNTTVRPAGGLSVEIRPGTGAFAERGLYSVILRFQNNGQDEVALLKRLDGSTCDRFMPYYRFTLFNTDRQPLQILNECRSTTGLYSGTRWPDDYIVKIKAGASFDMEEALPFEIEKDGSYTISFEYVYQPVKEKLPTPPGMWQGSIKSPNSIIDLRRKQKLQKP
jgi:hypothetical protein